MKRIKNEEKTTSDQLNEHNGEDVLSQVNPKHVRVIGTSVSTVRGAMQVKFAVVFMRHRPSCDKYSDGKCIIVMLAVSVLVNGSQPEAISVVFCGKQEFGH